MTSDTTARVKTASTLPCASSVIGMRRTFTTKRMISTTVARHILEISATVDCLLQGLNVERQIIEPGLGLA